MRDNTVRRLSRFHGMLFRFTGGIVGKRLVNNDMLLLSTEGRHTGSQHTVPLLYLREGEQYVVIASYGGRDSHPDWYHNLLAQPEVKVRTQAHDFDARARTATGTERERWWPKVVEAYAGYDTYQSRTERTIPIVILDPLG